MTVMVIWRCGDGLRRATNAKAKFSCLLNAAESEGPQLIHRRTQTFVVTTEVEIEHRLEEAKKGKRQ